MDSKMCKICGKTNIKLFNVYTIYGTINHTVYDNFKELYGSQVIGIINPSDCLCNRCVVVLDNVAKVKRRIWNTICRAMVKQRTAQKFDKVLQIFASVKMDQELDDPFDQELDDPFDQEEENKALRSNTPQNNTNLLHYTYSETYNKTLEDKIAFNQYQKTKQDNAKTDTSNRRPRRRRRSKRSFWTRRRCKSSASVTSYASSTTCDETDNGSVRSFSRVPRTPSCYTPASHVSDTSLSMELRRSPRRSTVEYDDVGRLVRKRTRSVSRAQEEEKQRLERMEGTKYHCNEKDCDLYFMDIDIFNFHRTTFHNALALHMCQECKKSYISAEHLKLHSLIHDNSSFFCLMCGVEMPNSSELQKHLDQHLNYSVLCKYCDKSFLSKSACDRHYQAKHRRNGCRRLYRSKQLIIDRVDFKSLPSTKQQDSTYKVYVKDSTPPVELDVNVDNLSMMNMDFYTEGNIQSDEVAETEQEISEQSYSELLTSSEMLEDVMDIGENCDDPS